MSKKPWKFRKGMPAIDWHVHTPCSCDCITDPAESTHVAMNRGLKGICFTDHVDFDPRDDGVGFFNWKMYNELIDGARGKFPGMHVKTGFELNWQEEFKKEIEAFLEGKQVDFLLGSVHWVSTGFINDRTTYDDRTFDDFIDEWIKESLSLLSSGIADGFAHFDYFYLQTRHVYPSISREDIYDYAGEVIESLITHDVSLEINTSALRKGLDEPFPSWNFLRHFRKDGGNLVHLGSDSHEARHVKFRFDECLKMVKSIFH
ncbi:histidinol-phosphatase HisJ family protein [Candidatus Bathyarchaeota archaeon]|nr:histidinol-phosphatase HisJ family protein [Candidatus Bathyarchaeota archaeon]